jgi:hypothetical protein
MDYARLIAMAWRMTWGHRFLWILALFAGGLGPGFLGGGNGGQVRWERNGDEFGGTIPQAAAAAGQATRWIADNQGMVAGIAAAAVAVGVLLLILSLICQGAMARSTADLARGDETSLGKAWAAGFHLFGRYLGLWLTLVGVAIAVAGAVAVLATVAFGPFGARPNPTVIGLAIAGGLLLLVLAVVAGVIVSIVVAFAQRAIAVQDAGPIAALRIGWQTLRGHPGDSVLTWILSLVLTVAAEMGAAGILAVLIGILAAIGYGFWTAAGFTAPTIAFAIVGGTLTVAAGLTLYAIGATFFWSYWTLVYLHLTGAIEALRPAPQPMPTQLSHVPPTV